jgi:D-3-phosphoglycerate dehydrogenase / 2-oxoglutarate reductase
MTNTNQMKKILTSPSSFGQISNEPFDILKNHGYDIINNPYGRKLTEEEVIELAKDCIGIVAGVEPLSAKVMKSLPELKCISRVGIGMDNVDMNYANNKGIIVANTPNGPTRGVAELTVGMAFALLRKIPQADASLKNREWKKYTGNLLYNKVIGVVGLGRIGRLVSEMFKVLGNPVVGFDPFPDKSWAEKAGIELAKFDEVLKRADILTLHIPGNADKTPVLGINELNLLKNNAFLLNLSRGGIVDEKALLEILKSKKIAGAAIDVFNEEPYYGPFCDLNNVVLTPHIGSYAEEGKLLMEIDAVNNLIDALK